MPVSILASMTEASLDPSDLPDDPIAAVEGWIDTAKADGVRDWDAMVVATADGEGVPSARVVLLRGVGPEGFAFYTSFESAKGRDLEANPRAALVLQWREQGRQVRVSGMVTRMTPEESVVYWASRPRGSRLSAWASRQSEVVASRAVLEATVDEVTTRFGDDDIPLPPFWGGYRVAPETVELWQHRDDRLHDRVRYRRDGGGWVRERLQP
jgi:pyridoxamine 5'-phosphate oxidase